MPNNLNVNNPGDDNGHSSKPIIAPLFNAQSRTRETILDERRQLRQQFGDLFDLIAQLLFRFDPIGINNGFNTDEYELETSYILPQLNRCHSADDVQHMVYDVVLASFAGVENAGQESQYIQIAEEIWRLWQSYQPS